MNLIKYLPHFYGNSEEVKELQEALSDEGTIIENEINSIKNQVFVDSATWGLTYWEKLLGLHTDTTQTNEVRRSRIKTYLRNNGTCTKVKLKNICHSYVNGEVEIIEDNANYKLTVKFVGENGVPANIDYLRNALREAIPAHLQFLFAYSYLLLKDVDAMTLNELEQTSLMSFGM